MNIFLIREIIFVPLRSNEPQRPFTAYRLLFLARIFFDLISTFSKPIKLLTKQSLGKNQTLGKTLDESGGLFLFVGLVSV